MIIFAINMILVININARGIRNGKRGLSPFFLYIVLGAMSKFVTFGVDLLQ